MLSFRWLFESVLLLGSSSLLALATPIEVSQKPVPFEINLTWENVSPDGYTRKAILMNGEFPGPTLYLNQGDDVEFLVTNNLPFPTTIHFHGIEQINTPWADGVPGLSQQPIQPGAKFLYKWTANYYGTYFYHAHERSHMNDGLYGAIYVRPSDSQPRPFSLITNDTRELEALRQAEENTAPVILSDWSHHTSEQIWDIEEEANIDAYCSNALLINGKGSITCLPQSYINANANPAATALLNGATLTDMGCLPANFTLAQGDFKHNYSAIPQGVFSGCKPSEGPQQVFKVNPTAGYASWDLISSAGLSTFVFSIDEHPFYVYAIDGRYVTPVKADALTITNGERYSIMVKLDKPVNKTYAVRSVVTGLNQLLNTTAVLEYDSSYNGPFASNPKNVYPTSQPYITVSGLNATANTVMYNGSLATPFPPIPLAAEADDLYVLKIGRYNASYRWFLNNGSLPLNLEVANPPLLFEDPNIYTNTSKNGVYNNGDNLTLHTLNNTWVDLILQIDPPLQPPHPFHKHSNKFFVIGSGQGDWKWASVTDAVKEIPGSFNLVDPPIRDTFATIVPTDPINGSSWVAIRYQVVNPGAFLLHCHIQTHLAGGMALALLDGVDKWPKVPPEYLHGNGI